MEDLVEILNDSLLGFKLDARCVNASKHRHFGFFDLKLGPKCQVNQIRRKSQEIALKIQSHTIPIVKPMPKLGIVRLQVVLSDTESVSLSNLFEKSPARPAGLLPFLLGDCDDGEVLWTDMSQNPHMIVAGSPGSGKTVLLHNMIANAVMCPNTTLYLVDPKGVEFIQYGEAEAMRPHVAGVATSYEDTLVMLDLLVSEMEDRYKVLSNYRLQSIEQFPNLFRKIVLIIDEVADLMLNDFSHQFENNLVRLAQKSRAAGIYIVLGTQRPSTDVITGLIKANFEARVACRVSSKVDSQIILGQPGAESLVGRGDAIISTKNHNFVRMQVGFVRPQDTISYCSVRN